MKDRGMIKWQPFNAVISSNKIINDILEENKKTGKPVLSEDQLNVLEEKINIAYKTKSNIKIIYYYNGYIKSRNVIIYSIDLNSNKIIFNDHSHLYIENILDIEL